MLIHLILKGLFYLLFYEMNLYVLLIYYIILYHILVHQYYNIIQNQKRYKMLNQLMN